MRKYTFTISILTLFAGMTAILFVFLVGNFYLRGMDQAYQITESKIDETNRNIGFAVSSILNTATSNLSVLAQVSDEQNILLAKDNIEKVMWEMLTLDENLASIFLTDTYGNFLQARRCPRLAVREIDNINGSTALDVYQYKDKNYATLSIDISKSKYDPRTRTWFTLLSKKNPVYWSEPYIFASTGSPGITLSAAKINEMGEINKVAAADFTLDTMSQILEQKSHVINGELMLFSGSGTVIATSFKHEQVDKDNKIVTTAALDSERHRTIVAYLTDDKHTGVIEDNGVRYAYFITKLNNSQKKDWYLASFIKESKIIGPIRKTLLTTILFSFFIIISIYFPVQAYLRRYFIKPIAKLKEQTAIVAERHFDSVQMVDTRILEFHDLADSMVSMSASIRRYEVNQTQLMDAIIKILAGAIDDKSPYTGGHCERVPVLAEMLAYAASSSADEPFRDFMFYGEDEWREFRTAAWLHDCGKIVTPEYVVDKATKLETIYNRIHEVRTRFEVLYRDAVIEYYERLKDHPEKEPELKQALESKKAKLADDFAFVAECNVGGEFLSPEKIERLKNIAETEWTRYFDNRLGLSNAEELRLKEIPPVPAPAKEKLLSDRPEHILSREKAIDMNEYHQLGVKTPIPENAYNHGELYNLSISRGTLTEEERFKINEHIIMTIKMLEQLPFTENLKRVPEYACGHHETMIGNGYPRRLSKRDLSIPARIMAIADIFEALTACDRPYKKAKTLSESIKIMSFMRNDGHIDPDIFALFLKEGIYKKYAEKYLDKSQIDDVDISKYL